jgi:hypothetical protein
MILDNLLVTCLGLHLLGDFYFQSDRMAEKKRNSLVFVLLHSLLYAFPFSLVLIFGNLSVFLALVGTHFLIDMLKFPLERIGRQQGLVFIVDQALHLLCIVLISLYSPLSNTLLENYAMQLRFVVLLLAVAKPVSVLFTQLFGFLKPELLPSGKNGAGKTIGYLERILLSFLFLMGQFGSIGWVIAAKAFARSKQISESPEFCEYFLVGTLFSLVSAVALYGVLFH